MRLTLNVFLLAGWAMTNASAQTLQPLDVKTGEWETTTVSSGTPTMAIPAGTLDKMPPEQRAIIEQRMKAAMAPRTTASRRCVTKETLAKAFQPANTPAKCAYTVVSTSKTKQQVNVACEMDKGAKSTGVMTVEAVDSSNMKGSMQIALQMAAAGGPARESNLSFTFTSKFIGPACSEDEKKK